MLNQMLRREGDRKAPLSARLSHGQPGSFAIAAKQCHPLKAEFEGEQVFRPEDVERGARNSETHSTVLQRADEHPVQFPGRVRDGADG